MIVNIEDVKLGHIFRFPGKKREYVKQVYNPHINKYGSVRCDDISHYIYKKKGTKVEID